MYERLPAPAASDDSSVWGDTARFYLIGLGGRGQKALQELGAWEPVKRRSVVVLGRKDWAPGAGVDEGVERIFGDDRPYKTAVILTPALTLALTLTPTPAPAPALALTRVSATARGARSGRQPRGRGAGPTRAHGGRAAATASAAASRLQAQP